MKKSFSEVRDCHSYIKRQENKIICSVESSSDTFESSPLVPYFKNRIRNRFGKIERSRS